MKKHNQKSSNDKQKKKASKYSGEDSATQIQRLKSKGVVFHYDREGSRKMRAESRPSSTLFASKKYLYISMALAIVMCYLGFYFVSYQNRMPNKFIAQNDFIVVTLESIPPPYKGDKNTSAIQTWLQLYIASKNQNDWITLSNLKLNIALLNHHSSDDKSDETIIAFQDFIFQEPKKIDYQNYFSIRFSFPAEIFTKADKLRIFTEPILSDTPINPELKLQTNFSMKNPFPLLSF